MTRFRSALIPLALTLTAFTALPQQAVAAPPKPVPSVAAATPDGRPASSCARTVRGAAVNPRLTSLFTAYGNDNSRVDDWTGADGTYSLRLPSGRELWIFSDTFLGRVNPDGSRPPVVGEGGDTVFLNLPQQLLRRREERPAVHHPRRHARRAHRGHAAA